MNVEEEIKRLEDEIKSTQYNKATEHHIGVLKAKIAKLKRELQRKQKKKKKGRGIKKEGDATVVLFGEATSLLSKLTNAKENPFDYSQGMLLYRDAKIQLVSFPVEDPEAISFANSADLVIKNVRELIGEMEDLKKLEKDFEIEEIKKAIYNKLNLIRIYTKKENKIEGAMTLRRGATVADVCENIHKDLKKNFKYALITGPSTKFPKQRVGLEHIVEDGDIITIISR